MDKHIVQSVHTPEDAKKLSDAERLFISQWDIKFKNAVIAKADYTKRWQRYYDAYNGEYFKNTSKPEYKSDLVSNYIFSIIETIRPIMLDNDPKFQSIPRQPEGMERSNDLDEALSYEWDREQMTSKLFRELITALVTGSSVFFLPWDSAGKNVRSIPVNPFNIFPDPLATCVEDAEYIIYASYKHEGILKRLFPEHADKLRGSKVNFSELVRENSETGARVDNQILTLEIWCRDYSLDDIVSEHDGKEVRKLKYPHGRVITICPELSLKLSDKPNPYKDGEFPFEIVKDYDIPGKFWGEGEVAQLLSPQTYMNELANSIIDNAKATANVPWIIDKNSGIGQGKITNRPGLVIRKNPGTEVTRPQPPSMPSYVNQAVSDLKNDMEQISGVFDTLKGNSETGVYTAQGILALQEAGQARIRLKVKVLEQALGRLACKWHSRMKQFWKEDRWMGITHPDGSYDFKAFKLETLKYDYDIKITAGSTMAVNRGAMLDLMVRLAQTQMPDGAPLVDRQAVVEYLPQEVKAGIMKRMGNRNADLEQITQQVEQISQQEQQDVQALQQSLEQMTGTIEKLNNQILQLQEAHAKMMEKQKQDQLIESTKSSSYNEGYKDAEAYLKPQQAAQGEDMLEEGTPYNPLGEFSPEFIEGISQLSDDELELLMQEHPDLIQLINSLQAK